MKYIKYAIGSLIISFGVLLVLVVLLRSLQLDAPEDIMLYLGMAWLVLAIIAYPLAMKIMRV